MTENIVELLPSLLARARALTSNNEDAEDLVERCLRWAIGVPPLKWSTHWDRNILFRRTIRWQASETNRKTSF